MSVWPQCPTPISWHLELSLFSFRQARWTRSGGATKEKAYQRIAHKNPQTKQTDRSSEESYKFQFCGLIYCFILFGRPVKCWSLITLEWKALVMRHNQANTSNQVWHKNLSRDIHTPRVKTQVFQMLVIKWKVWTIPFLWKSPEFFFVLVNYNEPVLLWHKSDIFFFYLSSVLIHLIHPYPSLCNQTIIHWRRETGCLFQTIL